MKKISFVLSALLSLVFITQVNASTFKNGDKIDILSASIPSDGSTISFTIPRGKYPSDSKILVYGEANVLCPIPGFEPEPKSIDKNPFTLLSEYKFTSSDIKSLDISDSTFITTARFDIGCGDMYAKVVSVTETVKPTDTQENRPKGGSEGAIDQQGNPLRDFESGSSIDVEFDLTGNILSFILPQGSYTLADWIIVLNEENTAIAKTLITNDMMEQLARGLYQVRLSVDENTKIETLSVVVSDTDVEIGNKTDLPVKNDDLNNKNVTSNSLIYGLVAFILIIVSGLGIFFLQNKKRLNRKK